MSKKYDCPRLVENANAHHSLGLYIVCVHTTPLLPTNTKQADAHNTHIQTLKPRPSHGASMLGETRPPGDREINT